jgi:hypothetical protein
MHKKNYLSKSILLSMAIGCILLQIASISHAGTFYVSPTGNAAWSACINSGTPCSASTAMANAQAGDVVYFRGGTYNPVSTCDREVAAMKPANSGTSVNPIIFMAYPGETPVIQGNNCGGPSFGTANVDWIVWDGFKGILIDNVPSENRFVMLMESNHITIRNCDLKGVVKTNYHNNALIESLRSTYVTIENNKLHDNNGDPSVVVNTTAILFWDTYYAEVSNNDIYNNSIGIYDKQDGNYNEYYNNHIWGGVGTQACNIGFQIKNQDDIPATGHDDKFYFNVVRNCSMGVYNELNSAPTGTTSDDLVKNIKIYNNVFYAGMSGSAGIHLSSQAANAEIYNNIIVNYQNGLRYETGPYLSTNHSNYNIFYPSSTVWNLNWSTTFSPLSAWTSQTTFDANSSVTNPLFAKPNGVNPIDFRPTAGSPAYVGGARGTYPTYRGVYSSDSANPAIGLSLGTARLNPPRNLR